jgi:hypothetical protein
MEVLSTRWEERHLSTVQTRDESLPAPPDRPGRFNALTLVDFPGISESIDPRSGVRSTRLSDEDQEGWLESV